MEKHHADTVRNLVNALQKDDSVRALLLGGSIAHGFARSDSDVDVSIVVDAADYQARRREHRLHYFNRELCAYDSYIDGKYVDLDFLRQVAAHGSEPARFAYEGAQILFSREPELAAVLAAIVRYPVEKKRERVERFTAQLLAWRWYFGEGVAKENRYLQTLAVQKCVLFGSRVVLAENELLYPYHKWMLRVLAGAKRQPPGLLAAIDDLLAAPTGAKVEAFSDGILAFADLDRERIKTTWPMRFMQDSELTWLEAEPAVDDL